MDQFDYLVVASTTAAVSYQLLADATESQDDIDPSAVAKVMQFLRVARLMRLVKIVRVMKRFKKLSFLVEGFKRSRTTIFYITFLLFFPYFYFFSNTLNQLIPVDHPDLDKRKYFGSIPSGMFTNFEFSTGQMKR